MQQDALSECAVVAPRRVARGRDAYWAAVSRLAHRGPFKARDVLDEIGLEGGKAERGHLVSYLRSLADAGIISADRHSAEARGTEQVYRLVLPLPTQPAVALNGNSYRAEDTRLNVVIPRGEAGAWMLMRKVGKGRKEFTAEAIVEQSRGAVDAGDLADYLARLMKGGFVEMTGVTVLKGGAVTRAYRLLKVQPETPRLSRDGVPLASPQRFACLWRAMKMLGYFTTLDLASSASLPELPISEEQAARYANDLALAGYLQMKERAGQPPLYRLKQTMNTGPCAPEVLRARFVWDPNTCRVVGDAARIEEVRP